MKFLQSKKFLSMLLGLILVLLFYNTNFAGKWIYPIKYHQQIQTNAAEFNLDPYIISSIIRVESNYKFDLVSKKGAIGLMQIMPETAAWIMERNEFSTLSLESLKNPEMNIQIGSWYLHYLSTQYSGYLTNESKLDHIAVLAAAYNAGPGNVKKWLNSKEWDGRLASIQQIPFGETRHFIQRVVYYYKKYTKYYDS